MNIIHWKRVNYNGTLSPWKASSCRCTATIILIGCSIITISLLRAWTNICCKCAFATTAIQLTVSIWEETLTIMFASTVQIRICTCVGSWTAYLLDTFRWNGWTIRACFTWTWLCLTLAFAAIRSRSIITVWVICALITRSRFYTFSMTALSVLLVQKT